MIAVKTWIYPVEDSTDKDLILTVAEFKTRRKFRPRIVIKDDLLNCRKN